MEKAFEKLLVDKLIGGDKEAFSTIFTVYYKDMVMFAYTFTKDIDSAEEIVQDMFAKLWIKHTDLKIKESFKSYILKTVQNQCLDAIRHKNVKDRFSENLQDMQLTSNDTENYIFYSDLKQHLDAILAQMPENIATTFCLSRFEGLKYHEIAQQMQVSVRTVEVRMSEALQILEKKLKKLY
jgi:RNA polymerase sigma-70 factor (ECF subfamily)